MNFVAIYAVIYLSMALGYFVVASAPSYATALLGMIIAGIGFGLSSEINLGRTRNFLEKIMAGTSASMAPASRMLPLRETSRELVRLRLYISKSYRGVRCAICSTMQDDAEPVHAEFTHGLSISFRTATLGGLLSVP